MTDAPPPRSPGDLFIAFTQLALQGFGGVLPVAQRDLVEKRRWLSREQFVETLSVGQVLPGPNIVNMSLMIGDRFFGLRGAFASLAGLMVVPLLIVLALAALYGGHITPAAASLGLEWYAEHTADAHAHPGKHPNIDRLLACAEGGSVLLVRAVAA